MGPPLSAKQRRPQSVAMELRGLRWPRPTKMNVTTFDPVPGGRDKPLYSPISGSCFSRSAIQSPGGPLRLFSAVQAATQALPPMQASRSITMPQALER